MDESQGAIYIPPKDGLPFLVVTFAGGDLKLERTTTRSEARVLLARRTRGARLLAAKRDEAAAPAKSR